MPSKKRPARGANVLSNRTASVCIHRNGLSIEIDSVPAVDGVIEVPDEEDGEDFVLPIEAGKRVGFV
jgi:hypothetical protein